MSRPESLFKNIDLIKNLLLGDQNKSINLS